MDAWIVILAIALLRGLAGWARRRNAQQRKREQQAGGGTAAPRQLPQPGDPDAFDLEEPDPFEEGQFSYESEAQRPEPPQHKTRRLPDEVLSRGGSGTSTQPEVGSMSEDERARQDLMQRLMRAAAQTSVDSRFAPSPAKPQRHPVAAQGAHIAHAAREAQALRHMLASPRRIREAILLREVLGAPVALRGPLRGSGAARHQPR